MIKHDFLKDWWVCFLVLPILFLFSTTQQSFGQDLYSLTDSLRVNERYFIQRNFPYTLSGRDTVKQGKYELFLKPYVKDTFLAQDYQFEQLLLNFADNVKEGPFILRSFSFKPALAELSPEGGNIQIPYSGTNSNLRGQYKSGNPTGQWLFGRYSQQLKEPADTVLRLMTFFNKNGIPNQEFSLYLGEQGEEMSGGFAENGSFDGLLVLRSREEGGNTSFSYRFEEGLLTGITGPDDRLIQPRYEAGNAGELKIREHALDSLFPKVISYYLPEISGEEKNILLQPLRSLAQAFKELSARHSVLANYLPGGLNLKPPTIKLPVYEPDSRETAFIQETYQRLFRLQNSADSLMELSAFRLNRYSYRELASLYARDQLLQDRIRRQRSIFEVLSGPLQQHINPEWFMSRRLEEISRKDTVTYLFNDKQYTEEVDFTFETEGLSPSEQYEAYVLRLEEMYTDISRQMAAKLKEQRLDTRLQEQEEQITALSAEIDQLADSLQLNLYSPEISRAYKNSFVEYKETLLQQYARMPAGERKDQVRYIINCLEKLRSGLESAGTLAQKEVAVDLAYTDNRLNPYTYTEMSVRLYEKLFNTYREKLVPYLVEEMLPAENCEGFLQKASQLEVLQDFMLEALSKKPARLERRVRPQDSPEAIIKKLGIPVVLK